MIIKNIVGQMCQFITHTKKEIQMFCLKTRKLADKFYLLINKKIFYFIN